MSFNIKIPLYLISLHPEIFNVKELKHYLKIQYLNFYRKHTYNNEGDYLDGDLRENPTEILIENNKRSLGEQMQNIPLLQGSENYPHRMYPSNLNLVVPSSSNHDESRTGIDSDFKMPKAKPPKIIMDAPVIEAEEGDLDALFGGSEEAEGEDQEDNIDIDIGSEDSDDNQDNPDIPEDEDEIHPSPNPEYDHIEKDKEMEAVDIKNDFKMPTGRDINDISKVKGIKAKSHFDMNILKDYKSEISFGLTEKSEEKPKEDSKK